MGVPWISLITLLGKRIDPIRACTMAIIFMFGPDLLCTCIASLSEKIASTGLGEPFEEVTLESSCLKSE